MRSMHISRVAFVALAVVVGTAFAQTPDAQKKSAAKPAATKASQNSCQQHDKGSLVKVKLTTSMGNLTLELDKEKAPLSVANFVKYVESGHYNGTVFHRVISNFMIQGGGFSKDLQQKNVQAPIKNESTNGLKNDVYTVAMARTGVRDSATAQFFINVKNNDFLNFSGENPSGWGYAVFGKVIEGADVVDKIKAVPTGSGGPFSSDVPTTPVVIEKAECIA
jgi:peptidyl-prolyl cis-trans isomerase B (cyclophilin B)